MAELASTSRAAPAVADAAAGSDDGRHPSSAAVSVIVPVTERPEDLATIYREYAAPLQRAVPSFEFVFVAGPAHRERIGKLQQAVGEEDPVRILEVGHYSGEAALVRTAMAETGAETILTLPAYHRVTPETLPALIAAIDGGADVAVARRHPRRDSWVNRVQTRLFGALVARLAGSRLDDLGCGVRAMRREVLEEVPLYGDFFRFFPILARREGFRVVEVDGPQHPLDEETRLYGPGIYVRRLIDILGVFFLVRFTWKPLRFFGLVGSALAGVGAVVLAILLVQRLGGQGIADRPMLLLGALLLSLGAQAIALGLVGELIVHFHAARGRRYRVRSAPEDVS